MYANSRQQARFVYGEGKYYSWKTSLWNVIWLQMPASLCRKNITYDITTIYLTTWEGKYPLVVVDMWISTEEINYYCQTVPVFDISELIRAPFVCEAFRKHNHLHVATLVVSVQNSKVQNINNKHLIQSLKYVFSIQ